MELCESISLVFNGQAARPSEKYFGPFEVRGSGDAMWSEKG